MNICQLCKLREATKKNSHIIPWALIKDVVNQPGFKERGYDVTFAISTFSAPSLYVGRRVLPTHVENVTKRDIEDNVIDYKDDPFSRDYIFCPECEANLGILENEFKSKVYDKLEKFEKYTLDTRGNKVVTFSEFEAKLAYLLIYSVFFRTSIVRFNNYSVDPKMEEKIRQILLLVLSKDKKTLVDNVTVLSENKLPFPVLLCYLVTDLNNGENDNMVIQNHCEQPYFIWANKLMFALFKKESHINSSIEYLYGVSQMLEIRNYFSKNRWDEFMVCILSNENRRKILLNTVEGLAELNIRNMIALFNDLCKKLLNRRATSNEKKIFGYHYSVFATEKFHNNITDPVVKAFAATFNIKE